MHNDTGPNAEPKEPEVSHPGTAEPPPPDAKQEAAGGGGGTGDEPPKSFEDILRQMREVMGGGETARPMTDEERRRMARSDLMVRMANLLPLFFEYISMSSPQPSPEEGDEPEPEVVPIVPVAEFIPRGTLFGSRPFDVEYALFGEQVKKTKSSARHHGFMLGMGLGSAMSALGAAALAKEFLWQVTDLTTDMGSVINSIFSRPAKQWDAMSGSGACRPARGRAPSPGMKYGAPFPDESGASECYEEADDAPQSASPGVGLPDFEAFMKKVIALKAQVDAGAVQVSPEVKEIFDEFGKVFDAVIAPAMGLGAK